MGDSGNRPQDPFAEPSRIIRESDPQEIVERVAVTYEKGRFLLPIMKWNIYISYPELQFEMPGFLDTFTVKLLALLYLARAKAQPLASQWVPYRELKGGHFYSKSFSETVEERVCRRFGDDIDGLREAGRSLGAREVDQGDLGMVIETLPRLPLLFILWRGDEEFEANAGILFDKSADAYLNAFELRMLCGEIVNRLFRIAEGKLQVPPPV